MGKDILYPLRSIHGKLYEYKLKIRAWKYLNFPLGDKYYIMGTPTHTNIGDSAIALAERLFLEKCITNNSTLKELSFSEVKLYSDLLPAIGDPHSHFFGMGGVTWAISGLQRKCFARSLLLSE